MAWHRSGNVNVTLNNGTVNGGSLTPLFLTNAIKPGYAFKGPDGREYEIATVASETQITLVGNYLGPTLSNQAYAIEQNSASAYSLTLEAINDLLTMLSTAVQAVTLKVGSPTETGAVAAFSGALMSLENSASTRFYISKGAIANNGYLEFAVAKSGRGRIGLVGNNNIVIDYSTDGSVWQNFITLDVTTAPSNPRISLGFPTVPKQYTIATLPTSIAGAMVYVSDLGGAGGFVVGDGTGWRRAQPAYSTDSSIASHTHTELVDANNIRLTGTLAGTQTITLSTTNARPGASRRYTRTGGGAFNWSINGLKNLATNQWCDVTYDGAAWYLGAFGSL